MKITNTSNKLALSLLITLLFLAAFGGSSTLGAPLAQSEPTGILAEAIGEANLRAGPGIEFDQMGTIYRGTKYQVYGQHELLPWILIAYPPAPEQRAWVYRDLVSLSAPLYEVPYVSNTGPLNTPPPPSSSETGTQTPTPTPAPSGVTMTVKGDTNVRFGPGVDYPRIERIQPGTRYTVTAWHSLYPWIQIALPESPNGSGWVFADVVEITGNLYALPAITAAEVGWPTLTPTPPYVVTSEAPWVVSMTPQPTPQTQTAQVDMQALGEQVLSFLLDLGYAPEEERFASVFALDLSTGDNFTLGTDIAYSGMSLIKIPILVTYYAYQDTALDQYQAGIIGNTMICSGNHTANAMLAEIGGGNEFVGAERVTETMQGLGLQNTFLIAPFVLTEPIEPDRPLVAPEIPANQTRAEPDPFNQSTPEDLGWLLNAVYQCALDESGPLTETFPGKFTATECRQIALAMSANKINVLTEAGVPTNTRVAHKHGWIDDTHGDAAIVFSPGGDFVLSMVLHQSTWLPYEESWPAMAEIARMIYNAYNPDQPLAEIHPSAVDETCRLEGNPLLADLTAASIPSLK